MKGVGKIGIRTTEDAQTRDTVRGIQSVLVHLCLSCTFVYASAFICDSFVSVYWGRWEGQEGERPVNLTHDA